MLGPLLEYSGEGVSSPWRHFFRVFLADPYWSAFREVVWCSSDLVSLMMCAVEKQSPTAPT
jgi:hypothetical protein